MGIGEISSPDLGVSPGVGGTLRSGTGGFSGSGTGGFSKPGSKL